MPSVPYVGAAPTDPRDTTYRLHTEDLLNAGVSRSYVDGRVDALAANKATKVYTDTQDAAYVSPTYYLTQDALLVPLTAKGIANGVATLDSSGKLPAVQTPVLGAGILRGPYGYTAAFGSTTGATPVKLADFPAGVVGINCQLMPFMTVIAISTNGRPIVEVRYSTTGDTTYAGQTLCAQGMGRNLYNDAQTITVVPVTALPNSMQNGIQPIIPGSANLRVTAWIYDSGGGSTTTQTGYVLSAALFYARVAV